MKRLLFIFLGLAILSSTVDAQYSINKTKYNYKMYTYKVGDPYNPSISGLASFFIPGLGQMISGEGRRGGAFLGGYVGCWVVYGIGAAQMTVDMSDGYYDGSGAGLVLLGAFGALAVNIWSIVDGVRVAKVNNMAFWDQQGNAYNLEITPFISPASTSLTGTNSAGLTMALRF